MPSTHEQTVNVALGEVLGNLRKSWRVDAEKTGGILQGGGRPDVLIEEASGWPVVIEAELSDHPGAEKDAVERLGRTVERSGRSIETAIALVYPSVLHTLDGQALRAAIGDADDFEYTLYTHCPGQTPERLPKSGWLRGSIRDLAMLLHRAAVPGQRVDKLAEALERGVKQASNIFTEHHGYGDDLGAELALVLGQTDDSLGQTRRMAMTVILNALVFHAALAEAGFEIGPKATRRSVRAVNTFRRSGAFLISGLLDEWEAILEENYWPIFASAQKMLTPIPIQTANSVLAGLWSTAEELIGGGVTRSHDLTGVVFQKLIADRKFLATFYTKPSAAALLAALTLPTDHAPGGADWRDAETLQAVQIGDFACGTGTLLSAAYQRLSFLHELHGGDPKALHAPMMQHGLVGLDVLNIAVHLTAAVLASSHPDTPFEGECLLTMAYGKQADGPARIGSLELLAESVQSAQDEMIGQAAAVTAGGRKPENVRDLVNRVQHGKFDLVIMNPPFTRPVGQEGEKKGKGNSPFAALGTDKATQKAMGAVLRARRGGPPLADGNAGMAADFLDLALRKVRSEGTIGMVLPLSAVIGVAWAKSRQALMHRHSKLTVVTIAGGRSYDSSFSADTGMAECLVIGSGNDGTPPYRAMFAVLNRQPVSAAEGEIVASEIQRTIAQHDVRRLEDGPLGGTPIKLGEEYCGYLLDCPLEGKGRPWTMGGIADAELAQAAYQLQQGRLLPPGAPKSAALNMCMAPIGDFSSRGPYHADIYWSNPNGTPRGPFELIKPAKPASTYPMLWEHDAQKERRLVVAPDAEGQIKSAMNQPDIDRKARLIWEKATRAHYNRDLRFNSQSLVVAMTERKCIGGRAWPSVIFENPAHEYAFALWCNSTLGLLLHWWTSNKTQSGRGTTTVTEIPRIPSLDVRALSAEQHLAARTAFHALQDRRFLPFDQIDEDPARAELDRRLLVDVLGLPESLCEQGGTMDLLRRKLAAEPQIHGGKRTRVVFHEEMIDGRLTFLERSEKRSDR